MLRKRSDFGSLGATGTVGRFFKDEYVGGGGRLLGTCGDPGAAGGALVGGGAVFTDESKP